MKKTGLVILFGFLAFIILSLPGISQVTPLGADKKAVWNIKSLSADPSCYKPIVLTHAVAPAKYKLFFEFIASKSLVPAGELWVSGEMISNTDTGSKPALNLAALSSHWADGTTNPVVWAGDTFFLTKVNSKYLKLAYYELKIKPGTTGSVIINVLAESKDKTGVYYSEKKSLTIKPCKPPVIPVK